MKKTIAIIALFVVVVNFAAPAHCGDPLTKLRRGVCNILNSPAEIPNRIGKVRASSGKYEACTYGLIQGIVMTGFRMAVGAIEVATFPFPIPENYEPIINDPEFFIID